MITVEQAIEMGITKEEMEGVCLSCEWAVDNSEGCVKAVGRWKDHHIMLGAIANEAVVESRTSYLEMKRMIYKRAIDAMV